jgi:hypothetical protein
MKTISKITINILKNNGTVGVASLSLALWRIIMSASWVSGDSCPNNNHNNHPEEKALSVAEFFPRIMRLRENRDGAVAVEFALVAIPFFLLVIGLLELSLMYAASAVLEGGTVAASRLIRTGQAQSSGDPASAFEELLCRHVGALIPCDSLVFEAIVPDPNDFADAEDLGPNFDDDGNLEPSGFDPGGVSDVVVIRSAYRFRFVTPFVAPLFANNSDNSVLLMSTVTLRNEPYDFED